MQTKPKFALYLLAAVIGAAFLLLALEAPGAAQAQTGDYDQDNDGLININYLEQLDAVHYDLNGDGAADPDADAAAYAAAFPGAVANMGCPDSGCVGYELTRSLDFNNPGSYAANAVRADWTSGGGWFPIGARDFDHSFATTFEGNNNTIDNLFIDDSHHEPDMIVEIAALIGRNEGTIRRVGVTNADVTGHYDVGILAGYNHGTIEDSWSSGAVTGAHNVGGLVGENDEDAVITRSWSSAVVRGPTDIGGLVGSNGGGISFSYATGQVFGENEVGGLVGESHRSLITNCYATGRVFGFEQTGGLVGRSDRADIMLSYATGEVLGNGGFMGGLVGAVQGGIVQGRQSGTIKFSYATGNLTTRGPVQYLGGLVGRAQSAHIIASYATGDIPSVLAFGGGLAGVSARTDIIASYATGNIQGIDNIGGLAGLNVNVQGESRVEASYSIGRVTVDPIGGADDPYAGGLVGTDAAGTPAGAIPVGVYIATYWDTERSTRDVGVGRVLPRTNSPEGKTTAELQAPTGYTGIYAGWLTDLDNADGDNDRATGIDDFWDFGTSSQYPALKVDFNGDGVATWQEFGNQDRTPAPPPPLPTPEPTPVTNEQVLGSLDGLLQALQAFRELLNMRLTGSDNGGGAMPAPTPSATPVTSPSPVATPVTAAACVTPVERAALAAGTSIAGTWAADSGCLSVNSQNNDSDTYYAKFYTFTLDSQDELEVQITSDQRPYVYLLTGEGKDGEVLRRSDADSGETARFSLTPGGYTLEVTTWNANATGDFTLELSLR